MTSRYYAIGADGHPTHTNAELTMGAIDRLMEQSAVSESAIDVLSCGTSTPDQLLPSHASMVHGLWKNRPMELNAARSAERRVGKECVSTCSSRWSQSH